MGMTIDGAIHELEKELRSQKYDCGTAQLSTGLRDAMKTAVDTMQKYNKIKDIYDYWYADFEIEAHRSMMRIGDVLEDGNDNRTSK